MWNLYSPSRFTFGQGSLLRIAEEFGSFPGKRPLIMISERFEQTNLAQRLFEGLAKAGVTYVITTRVAPESPIEYVSELFNIFKENNCDSIIAVGGGGVLDLAKALSILPTNGGVIEDYLGLHKVPKPTVPKILVPTTAGTGSEATNIAVLSSKSMRSKKGIVSHHLFADWAVIEPELTYTVPEATTLSTGLDAFCQCLEGFTSKGASPLVDVYALKGMDLISKNIDLALAGQKEGRDEMCLGAYLSGIAIAGGNSGTNISHAIGNTLGGLYGIPHGLSVTMVLQAGIEFNSKDATYKKRLDEIKKAIGLDVLKFIGDSKKRFRIPRLQEMGIPKSDFQLIATKVMEEQQRLLINNRREVISKDIELMLESAY